MTSAVHRPRKSLGQHFLHQRDVVDRIITAFAPQPEDHVVEIGPGLGVLTEVLVNQVARLDVVELDRDLADRLLAHRSTGVSLHVHHADALSFDYCGLVSAPNKLRVIGNLPYNISTPILFKLLACDCLADLCLMLQRELVDRIVAPPGGKDYGRLSVMVQQRCRFERVLTVGAGAFTPAPKVSSAVIRLWPQTPPPYPVANYQRFESLVRGAFSQRRKTLRNALKSLLSVEQIRAAGIEPNDRPEQLSVADYARLSET